MKSIKNLLYVIAFCAVSSCTKDEFSPNEWGIEPQLELSPLAIMLTPSHLSDTVTIKTNYLDYTVSGDSYWIYVKKIEEYPAIIVTANEMSGKEDKRECYVTVTVKRGGQKLSRQFVVIQFKEDVFK